MNATQRGRWFAGGHVTVGTISQFIRGDFVTFFVGKLRGIIVGSKKRYKFKTAEGARRHALHFKKTCQRKAVKNA
jgi:hypothetical protein